MDDKASLSPLLEVERLSVSILIAAGDLHAVHDISFTVKKGETLCIVGESGCGKSLSALAIMGLLPKKARRTGNRLVFSGTDLLRLSEREMADIRGSRITMIFQEPMTSLNPAYNIGNQLMETLLRHRKVSRSEARDRSIFLLEKTGITAASRRLGQYPHQLSGGLRQRVMIAMALMCEPELIIADEPTTALDVTIQAQILNLLAELQREFHMAMILITHDLGIVARAGDRVEVMYASKIVEAGSVHKIFQSPMHPYTQGLLACIPLPGKTSRGEHLGSIPGMVPTLIGEFTGCNFYNRCPYAQKACAASEPQLHALGPDHQYRCLLEPDECLRNAEKVMR